MELHLRHQGARELEGSDNVSAVPVLRRIGAKTEFEDLKGIFIARQTRGSIHPGPQNRRTRRTCAEDQRKLGGPKSWLTKFSSLDS